MLRLINANDITSMTDNTATPADETLDEALLYCRQFILGPGFINVMPGWQYIEIDSRLKLSMHPEVEVERIVCAEKTLVAIGSIFDSLAPAKSNRDILAELIVKADNIEALTKATGHLGGRWLLIAKFLENGKSSVPLKPLISLNINTVFLSAGEFREIFTAGGWDAFYDRYPNSGGLMSLSRIALNSSETQALLYVSNQWRINVVP